MWCRAVAFACFQPREEVRFHGGERRRDGKECREGIVHDRPCSRKLHIELVKGFNQSVDADINGAISGLKHVATVGHFDVFNESDLLRILPDTVIKDFTPFSGREGRT